MGLLAKMTRKRRWTPPRDGWRKRVSSQRRVAVVGGGIAGIASAVILAERGVNVVLLEAKDELGGRLRAWDDRLDDGTSFEMDRGFHAFFRQYYNLRNLLRRIDPDLSNLIPLEDYPILGADGAVATFSDLPSQPPLNLIEVVRRSPALDVKSILGVETRGAFEMLRFQSDRTYARYDEVTAADYLDSLNFPPDARALLFDVFAHSFFNPEETMSAAELLMMFHFYFLGNSEGLVFDVLDSPFGRGLWRPFSVLLSELGVEVCTGTRVTGIAQRDDGWRVDSEDASFDVDGVVLGVTVTGLQSIVDGSPALGDATWRQQVADMETTLPFAVWRLWMDVPSAPGRAPFVGTADSGLLDNISLYHLFQGESRRWAEAQTGSVVELHAYAIPEGMAEAQVRSELLSGLHTLYPEYRSARLLEERFFMEQDCPAFETASHRDRPTVATPFRGIKLAGDCIRLPIPTALMERAATSGFMAANELLADWDVRGEEIWTIAPTGLLSALPDGFMPARF